jgi:hypothetical protein
VARRSAGHVPSLLVALSLLCVALSELGAALPAHASSVTRRPQETPESFAKRNGPPRTTLVHHVIETRAWGGTAPAIIAFYEEPFEESGQEYRRIAGYVFVPAPSQYRKVLIGTFDPEGSDPNIETVFFARVSRDPLPKLFIIVSWPQVHYDVRGTFYATFVYAAPARRPGHEAQMGRDPEQEARRGGASASGVTGPSGWPRSRPPTT